MNQPRPATVVMVAFATGSITINCQKTKPEIIALMRVPYFNEKGDPNEVTMPSVSEQDVMTGKDPRTAEIIYVLKEEEVNFMRKDVVFWSVSKVTDKPIIDGVGGLISIKR